MTIALILHGVDKKFMYTSTIASYNGGPNISRLGHVTQVYVIFNF